MNGKCPSCYLTEASLPQPSYLLKHFCYCFEIRTHYVALTGLGLGLKVYITTPGLSLNFL